jgi:hypothetical protein
MNHAKPIVVGILSVDDDLTAEMTTKEAFPD